MNITEFLNYCSYYIDKLSWEKSSKEKLERNGGTTKI